MRITVQRRLAASILKCSPKRIWFDQDKLDEIKESITKQDIKSLIAAGTVRMKPEKGVSRGRARHIMRQKSKGLRKGSGSRKGKKTARLSKKEGWMKKVRIQRGFLKELKAKALLTTANFRQLYRKSKGGFFRSKRHIKLYLDEHQLVKK